MTYVQKSVEKTPTAGKYNDDEWVTITRVELSKSPKTTKFLTLKHPKFNIDFILADLRIFNDSGRATRNGVCLTEFEFDYLAKVLVFAKTVEQRLVNKTGARILCIRPKEKIRGVELTQTVNDRVRKLRLNEAECTKIVNDYGSYYSIIEECLIEDDTEELKNETNICTAEEYKPPQLKMSSDKNDLKRTFSEADKALDSSELEEVMEVSSAKNSRGNSYDGSHVGNTEHMFGDIPAPKFGENIQTLTPMIMRGLLSGDNPAFKIEDFNRPIGMVNTIGRPMPNYSIGTQESLFTSPKI